MTFDLGAKSQDYAIPSNRVLRYIQPRALFRIFAQGEAECKKVEKVPEVDTLLFVTKNVNSDNEPPESFTIETLLDRTEEIWNAGVFGRNSRRL